MSVNRRESVHSLLPEAAQENISMPLYQSRVWVLQKTKTAIPSSSHAIHATQYPGKITPGQFEMGVRRAAARSSMGPPCCTSYPNPKNFLRHIKTAPQPSHNAPVTTHRRPKHKPPIPHGDQPHSHHTHKDYVTLNKQAVATIRKGSKSSTSCSYLFKKDFGRVPDYLVERQKAAQMAAREKESHRARQQQQVGVLAVSMLYISHTNLPPHPTRPSNRQASRRCPPHNILPSSTTSKPPGHPPMPPTSSCHWCSTPLPNVPAKNSSRHVSTCWTSTSSSWHRRVWCWWQRMCSM